MKFKLLLSVFLLVCLVVLISVVQAPKPIRGFIMGLPDEVEAAPGDFITVNGTILNIGWWWLHDFNISVTGLPESYEYAVNPEWFEHVRILREWTPEEGVYIVPEEFSIFIKVPTDSAGVFLVNVTGKEWMSWKRVENSTTFILRVSSPPKISLSDIVVPETVREYEAFSISLDVNNEGAVDQSVSLGVIAPEDWIIDPKTQSLTVGANASKTISFSIIPSNTSGQISIYMEYPFRKEILNLTKTGPFIVPTAAPLLPLPEIPTFLSGLVEFLSANPVVTIIAIILVVIILWNLWQITKQYRVKKARRKPERMEKQVETKSSLEEQAATSLVNILNK